MATKIQQSVERQTEKPPHLPLGSLGKDVGATRKQLRSLLLCPTHKWHSGAA